jgi:hypothetical protein
MNSRILGGTAFAAVALAATPAMAQDNSRTSVTPYIELSQVLTSDVQSGDVLTYSSAAAGVDVTTSSRRLVASISARYEHQFAWSKQDSDADIISGAATVRANVARGLSIEGGALATRSRNDIRGDAPVFFNGTDNNVSKIYSGYVGPTLATGTGPVFLNAGYRYGYTKVTSPGSTGIAPGSAALDFFDRSQTQDANVSTGFKSGTLLPFGVTLSGGWSREDQNQLDARFDDFFGRGDVIMPVSATLALEAGVGYEKITSSSRDPIVDGTGAPVLDANGRFETDKSSPRRIAYRTDGLYYDAGVVWRPSPRTMLEARFGRRYGDWSATGSFSYAPSQGVGIQVGVYDGIETFGRQLQQGIQGLPDQFSSTRDALAQQFNGCTFGTKGGGASGACLNSALQSISTSTYRARGVDLSVSMTRGHNTLGFGAGYANRRYFAPDGSGFVVNGVTDQSYYAQVFYSTPIGRFATFNADVFANYFESGLNNSGLYSVGATGSLTRGFGRLSTSASVGIYNFSSQGQDDQTSLQAQLGARYHF